MTTIEQRSMRSIRLAARAPRWAVLATAALLSTRAIVDMAMPAAPPGVVVRPATPAASAAGLDGFAEGFARAYLTFDASAPQRREFALAPYLAPGADPHAWFALPSAGRQRVAWTASVGQRRLDRIRTAVTVDALIDGAQTPTRLAVVVSGSAERPAVVEPPALVGTPAPSRDPQELDRDEVDDPQLVAVVRRALTNYLGGQAENLRADLAPGADLPTPGRRLRVTGDPRVEHAGRGRVSAEVVAEDRRGAVYTLRYELAVVRRDRWYLADLLSSPERPKEASTR